MLIFCVFRLEKKEFALAPSFYTHLANRVSIHFILQTQDGNKWNMDLSKLMTYDQVDFSSFYSVNIAHAYASDDCKRLFCGAKVTASTDAFHDFSPQF